MLERVVVSTAESKGLFFDRVVLVPAAWAGISKWALRGSVETWPASLVGDRSSGWGSGDLVRLSRVFAVSSPSWLTSILGESSFKACLFISSVSVVGWRVFLVGELDSVGCR